VWLQHPQLALWNSEGLKSEPTTTYVGHASQWEHAMPPRWGALGGFSPRRSSGGNRDDPKLGQTPIPLVRAFIPNWSAPWPHAGGRWVVLEPAAHAAGPGNGPMGSLAQLPLSGHCSSIGMGQPLRGRRGAGWFQPTAARTAGL
jgi:hypothetical protein